MCRLVIDDCILHLFQILCICGCSVDIEIVLVVMFLDVSISVGIHHFPQKGIIGSSCRADVTITYPVAFSRVFNILHAAYVNNANSSGRGLDVIKSYTTTRFVFYAGFDMGHQQFWLAVGI